MKQLTIFFNVMIFLLALFNSSNAEENLSDFTLDIGLNLGNMFGSIADDVKLTGINDARVKPGILAGMNFGISLSQRLSISPGIYYSQKGDNFTLFEDEDSKMTQRFSFDFIEIPLSVKIKGHEKQSTGVGYAFRPFVSIGGTFSYMTRAKIKWISKHPSWDMVNDQEQTSWATIGSIDLKHDIMFNIDTLGSSLTIFYKDMFRPFDINAFVNFGIECLVSNDISMNINCSYYMSVLSLSRTSDEAKEKIDTFNKNVNEMNITVQEDDLYLGTFSIIVGFSFKISNKKL